MPKPTRTHRESPSVSLREARMLRRFQPFMQEQPGDRQGSRFRGIIDAFRQRASQFWDGMRGNGQWNLWRQARDQSGQATAKNQYHPYGPAHDHPAPVFTSFTPPQQEPLFKNQVGQKIVKEGAMKEAGVKARQHVPVRLLAPQPPPAPPEEIFVKADIEVKAKAAEVQVKEERVKTELSLAEVADAQVDAWLAPARLGRSVRVDRSPGRSPGTGREYDLTVRILQQTAMAEIDERLQEFCKAQGLLIMDVPGRARRIFGVGTNQASLLADVLRRPMPTPHELDQKMRAAARKKEEQSKTEREKEREEKNQKMLERRRKIAEEAAREEKIEKEARGRLEGIIATTVLPVGFTLDFSEGIFGGQPWQRFLTLHYQGAWSAQLLQANTLAGTDDAIRARIETFVKLMPDRIATAAKTLHNDLSGLTLPEGMTVNGVSGSIVTVGYRGQTQTFNYWNRVESVAAPAPTEWAARFNMNELRPRFLSDIGEFRQKVDKEQKMKNDRDQLVKERLDRVQTIADQLRPGIAAAIPIMVNYPLNGDRENATITIGPAATALQFEIFWFDGTMHGRTLRDPTTPTPLDLGAANELSVPVLINLIRERRREWVPRQVNDALMKATEATAAQLRGRLRPGVTMTVTPAERLHADGRGSVIAVFAHLIITGGNPPQTRQLNVEWIDGGAKVTNFVENQIFVTRPLTVTELLSYLRLLDLVAPVSVDLAQKVDQEMKAKEERENHVVRENPELMASSRALAAALAPLLNDVTWTLTAEERMDFATAIPRTAITFSRGGPAQQMRLRFEWRNGALHCVEGPEWMEGNLTAAAIAQFLRARSSTREWVRVTEDPRMMESIRKVTGALEPLLQGVAFTFSTEEEVNNRGEVESRTVMVTFAGAGPANRVVMRIGLVNGALRIRQVEPYSWFDDGPFTVQNVLRYLRLNRHRDMVRPLPADSRLMGPLQTIAKELGGRLQGVTPVVSHGENMTGEGDADPTATLTIGPASFPMHLQNGVPVFTYALAIQNALNLENDTPITVPVLLRYLRLRHRALVAPEQVNPEFLKGAQDLAGALGPLLVPGTPVAVNVSDESIDRQGSSLPRSITLVIGPPDGGSRFYLRWVNGQIQETHSDNALTAQDVLRSMRRHNRALVPPQQADERLSKPVEAMAKALRDRLPGMTFTVATEDEEIDQQGIPLPRKMRLTMSFPGAAAQPVLDMELRDNAMYYRFISEDRGSHTLTMDGTNIEPIVRWLRLYHREWVPVVQPPNHALEKVAKELTQGLPALLRADLRVTSRAVETLFENGSVDARYPTYIQIMVTDPANPNQRARFSLFPPDREGGAIECGGSIYTGGGEIPNGDPDRVTSAGLAAAIRRHLPGWVR